MWQAQRSRRAPQEAGRGCAAGATAASTSLTLHSCRYFSDLRRCVMSPAHRWCALAAPLPPSCRPRSALGRPVNTQILVLARDMGPLAPWCYTWLLYLDKTGNVDPVFGGGTGLPPCRPARPRPQLCRDSGGVCHSAGPLMLQAHRHRHLAGPAIFGLPAHKCLDQWKSYQKDLSTCFTGAPAGTTTLTTL